MTIKTSTGSSKTELSSRGKRPFKVFGFSHFFLPQTVVSADDAAEGVRLAEQQLQAEAPIK